MTTPRLGIVGGSLRQRGHSWEARVYLPDGTRKSVSGKTPAEVKRAVKELFYRAERGVGDQGEMPLSDYLNNWLETCRGRIAPNTWRHYEGTLRLYVIPVIGKRPLGELSPADINQVLETAKQKGLTPRGVHHIRAVVRCALNEAMRMELVMRNVATLVRAPKVNYRQIDPYTVEEGRKMLEAVRDTDLDAVVHIALVLGLRQGEILGLRWQDIDFASKTLRVAGALSREGKASLVPTKTDRSRRVLPMPKLVSDSLLRQQTRQVEQRQTSGIAWEELIPGLIFTMPYGWPMRGNWLTKEFRAMLKYIHISYRGFHTLRHSAATLALASGVDLKTVSSLLGHSQIGITANTYASVVPQLQKDATDRIESLLKT